MKALTIRAPWAWAVFYSGKNVESRTASIGLGALEGQRLAVHVASRRAPWDAIAQGTYPPDVPWAVLVRDLDPLLSPTGVIAGTVRVGPTFPPGVVHPSPWALPGHWVTELTDPLPLRDPVPAKGRLGVWTVPPHLEAAMDQRTAPKGWLGEWTVPPDAEAPTAQGTAREHPDGPVEEAVS